jgi:ankyrin repeat protein
VRFLIGRGANVNCIGSVYSPVGWFYLKQVLLTSSLGVAAHDPKLECIPVMLIRAGAKVNRGILPKPVPWGQHRSMLGLAAYFGLLKTVKAMIAAGANVDLKDNLGRTPLCNALEEGHAAVARALVRAGAKMPAKRKVQV